MPNPMFNNNTSPNGATQPGNSVNDSYKRYKRGYNKFNLSRPFYNTERFADINLIEVFEGVEGDKIPFGNKHYIRSYTMNSPIMFDLMKKKTYFMVDNQAILPRNWGKVYKHPNKGDDVKSDVNCFTNNMLLQISNILSNIVTTGDTYAIGSGSESHGAYNDAMLYTSEMYNFAWRFIFLLESIFSDGSLLASMNCHLSSMITVRDSSNSISDTTFDEWLEETLSWFDGSITTKSLFVNFLDLSKVRFTNDVSASITHIYQNNRVIYDMIRTYSNFEFLFSDNSSTNKSRIDWLFKQISRLNISYDIASDIDDQYGLNLSRLIAYQLVCTQFYTNDSVDNIYTAELFNQNAESIFRKFYSAVNSFPQFTYNGVQTMYDVFSGKCIDIAFERIWDFLLGKAGNFASRDFSVFTEVFHYLHLIFFYRKSLRYGDYFVGSRTLPYAPADVTADVVGNGVSAINITRAILTQRFANSVERIKNTWKDYISGVMDGVTPPNPLEPRFLASSTSKVAGFEVENTADAQFTNKNITTILKSGDSNYVYEVEVGEPCIIIGVSTYEVAGVYSRTVERFFKHANRFDMFNKFMQNIGDQEITMNERSAAFSPSRIFGYTPRHMEYKQRYPIAAGGFVANLAGYAFIRDNKQSGQLDIDYSDSALKITSSFIRNRNSEMDRFYDSLTGLTLASYFHFFVKYENIVTPSRQMEYSPSIL